MQLEQNELNYLQKFASDACGLIISDEKEYLIRCRLSSIIEQYEMSGYKDLVQQLEKGNHKLKEQVVTELTTHETYFFRDVQPFCAFQSSILPWLQEQIIERKNKTYQRKGSKASIWCAASSTGQEPYSLAMLIEDAISSSQLEVNDISILASDVSSDVLASSMQGHYHQSDIERGSEDPYPLDFRLQFFDKKENHYVIQDRIKQMVDFKTCNLVQPFTYLGGFDVIFCRNVLIYFNENNKREIIEQFHSMLSPGGFLVIGASEQILQSNHQFESIHADQALIYRKI